MAMSRGGIGEHTDSVRNAVFLYLDFLKISRTLIIPANEERYMAIEAAACLGKAKALVKGTR